MTTYIHKENRKDIQTVEQIAGSLGIEYNAKDPWTAGYIAGYVRGACYEEYTKPIVDVVLWTQPNCKRCKDIDRLLDSKNILHHIEEDENALYNIASGTGFTSSPILQVGKTWFIAEHQVALNLEKIKDFVKGKNE